MAQVQAKGLHGINRMTMLNMLNNMTAGSIGITYNLGGPQLSASTSCSTGLGVIADGYMMIKNSKADLMLCGSAEDIKNEFVFQACLKMQALFNKPIQDPTQASRPFDIQRNGFVLAEGAGALVLESLEHALGRGANI
jgi:3-oxoacyl-[acyl-carrier-protein] synthase II